MATKQKTAVLEPVSELAGEFRTVKISAVSPHPDNPRRDVGDISELAADIKSRGLDHPLVVVPAEPAGGYVIVAGHRRFAACKEAGLKSVLVRVRDDWDLRQQRTVMLSENLHRSDLSPIEEAAGYQQLLDLDLSVDEVAAQVSRSATTVRTRVSLLGLPERAREGLHTREFTLEDALSLERIEDPAEREALAEVLGTRDFEWKKNTALRNQEARQKVAALVKELRERGFTVLEEAPADPADIEGRQWSDWFYDASALVKLFTEEPNPNSRLNAVYDAYHGDPAGVTWGLWIGHHNRIDLWLWRPQVDEPVAELSAEEVAEQERVRVEAAAVAAASAALEAEANTAFELRSAWLKGRLARKFTAKETATLLDWLGKQAVLETFEIRDDTIEGYSYLQSLADLLSDPLAPAVEVFEERGLADAVEVAAEDIAAILGAASGVTGAAVLLARISTTAEPSKHSRPYYWETPPFELKAYYELLVALGYQPSSAEIERLGLQRSGE